MNFANRISNKDLQFSSKVLFFPNHDKQTPFTSFSDNCPLIFAFDLFLLLLSLFSRLFDSLIFLNIIIGITLGKISAPYIYSTLSKSFTKKVDLNTFWKFFSIGAIFNLLILFFR